MYNAALLIPLRSQNLYKLQGPFARYSLYHTGRMIRLVSYAPNDEATLNVAIFYKMCGSQKPE